MKLTSIAAVALLSMASLPATAATFVIINTDAPGEGINDTTPVPPIGGNPGTTLGQQRLNVVQRAVDHWAARLDSAVPIRVHLDFTSAFCDTESAVLVFGAPARFIPRERSPGGELRWFTVAHANALDGFDHTPDNAVLADADVILDINSLIDAGCDGGAGWNYGYDAATNAPADQLPLLPAVIAGIAQGVALWLKNDPATGIRDQHNGVAVKDVLDDVLTDVVDGLPGIPWANLQDGVVSANSFDKLTWGGAHVNAGAASWLLPKAVGVVHGTQQRIELNNGSLGPRLALLATRSGRVVQSFGPTNGDYRGCPPLQNPGALAGKIAIADRGGCTFAEKALAAQDAGAIALLVVNNEFQGLPPMGGSDPALVIPSLGISSDDGALFLDDSTDLSIGLDIDDRAGTSHGMVRMGAASNNAPPVRSGVSRFASSVTPNALMRVGYANRAVDDDLTVAMLRDIGWPLLPGIPNKRPYLDAAATFRALVDQPSTLTDMRFGDSDAEALPLSLRFQVSSGSILLAPGDALQTSGSGSSDASVEGSRNALLRHLMNGGVRFLSAPGNTADVALTVTVDDNGNSGSGGALSAVDTATIEVAAAGGSAPVATAQALSTPRDSELAIELAGADADGDGLAFAVLTQPQHGTLSGTFGNYRYTPDTGYVGSDGFSFVALDGVLMSDPADVTIAVTLPTQEVAVFANGFEAP